MEFLSTSRLPPSNSVLPACIASPSRFCTQNQGISSYQSLLLSSFTKSWPPGKRLGNSSLRIWGAQRLAQVVEQAAANSESTRRRKLWHSCVRFCRKSGSSLWVKGSREGRRCWRAAAAATNSNSQPEDVKVSLEDFEYDAKEVESEEEARTRNWKERAWAPWEQLLTPEAQFALDSLAGGEEEPAVSREVFKNLDRKYYAEQVEKQLEEAAKKVEDERMQNAKFEGSIWDKPLVFTLTPPRDWPPPGWKVDAEELAFIRGAHSLDSKIVTSADLDESNLQPKGAKFRVPRWEMFLKQYDEWVAANRQIMEQEALEVDKEYYAGRRRTGAEYGEGMYELPFIYPGQHYFGVVTYVSLYEGAFVYFGGVHDGWVPILDNDWYEIRKHIRVGTKVHVEVIAKRDPYRFRFPIEMRFVEPHIDHLIFRRFKYPPIFGRTEDTNLDEVAREADRPYYPKLRPEVNPGDEEKLAPVHPYVRRLWMVHEAEQMVLEDEEGVHDGEEWDEWVYEEEDDPTGEWASEPGLIHETEEDFEVPTIVMHIDEKYLNLEEARVEREVFKKLAAEAQARGEEFEEPEGRFHHRMKELNDMHQKRQTEQKEALVRDRACRSELGLPLEEPGRYADKSFWGKNPYDPREPQWRHDYWEDPAKLKEELSEDSELQSGPEEAVVDQETNDLIELILGDTTTANGGNVASEAQRVSDPIIPVDADSKANFGEPDDRGTVNGTAANSLNTVRDVFDVEGSDWKGVDNGDIEIPEHDEDAGDDLKTDDE